jgi:hypothetical protein
MSLNRQSIRALHTVGQSARKTILYGWGQTQALPLTRGHIDRVFNQPTCLKHETDYALPVSIYQIIVINKLLNVTLFV